MLENEPATAYERLYSVDDLYLHIQRIDEGFDYTLYSKKTYREVDGGQLDSDVELLIGAALEICALHELGGISPLRLEDIEILDDIQEEAWKI